VNETSGSGARTDFAVIDFDLEVIQKRPARLPARRGLPATAFGIIFTTWTTLSLPFFAVVDKISRLVPAPGGGSGGNPTLDRYSRTVLGVDSQQSHALFKSNTMLRNGAAAND
jgi:hypothetical protein